MEYEKDLDSKISNQKSGISLITTSNRRDNIMAILLALFSISMLCYSILLYDILAIVILLPLFLLHFYLGTLFWRHKVISRWWSSLFACGIIVEYQWIRISHSYGTFAEYNMIGIIYILFTSYFLFNVYFLIELNTVFKERIYKLIDCVFIPLMFAPWVLGIFGIIFHY